MTTEPENFVKIPYGQLNPETLRAVVEEFVTRDGTDYGEVEADLNLKIEQILGQLKSGKVILMFDQETQTSNIVSKDDPRVKKIGVSGDLYPAE
jgi:hypothetical protein